jgi:hypothetical protein
MVSRIRNRSVSRHMALVGTNYDIDLMNSKSYPVSFEVLTEATMKKSSFCDVTSWTPVQFHRRFGRTYCFHLQCHRVCRALLAASCMLHRLALKMEAGTSSKTSINYLTTRRRNPYIVGLLSLFWKIIAVLWDKLAICKPVYLCNPP